jgi:hypothetical protein
VSELQRIYVGMTLSLVKTTGQHERLLDVNLEL